MTDCLTHRGPDAGGYFLDGHIGLGHRRLSIIDLATGDQPLGNEDGSVQVVFNGEIYNFADVREQLCAKGHVFSTRSDTEVIVHGFEEWGEDCVTRFRGMFAFAVWDRRTQTLLLARDRLGVKPLYYALDADGIAFGSELKSLLEDPTVARAWDPSAIDEYLTLGYIAAPRTIYTAIRKLDAGHTLRIDGNRPSLRQYWDLQFTGDGDPSRERVYLDRLDELLHEAVRLRLVSDVPIGAFLSGGIDSSAVVAAMARTSRSPVLTMTVGFGGEHDEVQSAQAIAAHLGVRSESRMITPDVEALLPRLAWHFDEPFGDSSAVPTYCVSAAAREHVTVALSGDGGDELWAGYARHRVEHAETRARDWLGPMAATAGWIGHVLPRRLKGVRSLRQLRWPRAHAYAVKHAYELFEDDWRRRCYTPAFAASVRGHDPYGKHRALYDRCQSPDPLDRALYVDTKTYLVEDILTKVDRASMAVSLESREPLLDHVLLEYAATIPSSLKLRDGTSKYLLRKLLEPRVPSSVLHRRKQGFDAPIGRWLAGSLRSLGEDLLFDGRLAARGIFETGPIRRMWDEHCEGVADHRHRLWSLVMLELWFRTYPDAATASRASSPAGRRSESAA